MGHARLINERFGRFWAWFSVGDLFLLNFLTIVTEFIGVSLALRYFGISPYISVPVAAVVLVGITASGSFRRWERAIFVLIATSLVLYPLALASGPHYASIAYHLVVPGIQSGATSAAVLLIIAIVGTTVAPWQLFFQQSNVVDKRITPRFIGYERADTAFGSSSSWPGRSRSWWWPCSLSVARTWPGVHRCARGGPRAGGSRLLVRRAVRDRAV